MRLSDVLKNKSHEETPLEKQQRLQIEAEIADRARQEEEAALEAELQNEIIDNFIAIEEEEKTVIEPVIEPVKIPKPPNPNPGQQQLRKLSNSCSKLVTITNWSQFSKDHISGLK